MTTDNRVALVTGAARGIGLAIAQRLSRDGLAVALADLDQDALDRAAATIDGPVATIRLDVTDRAAVIDAVARTEADLGAVSYTHLTLPTTPYV